MERRTFLQSAIAAGGLVVMPAVAPGADEPAASSREYFEIRTYTLKPGKQKVMDDYLRKALIPALNRFGVKQVGAFTRLLPPHLKQPTC